MRKKIPLITESEQELKELINKYNHDLKRRSRLKMLQLFKAGTIKTILKAVEKVGCNRQTIGRWLLAYEQGGIKQMLEIKTVGRKKGQRTLSAKVFEALQAKLNDSQGFDGYKEIQDWLKTECQTDVKYKTLHGIVFYRLKAKPKVPRPVNLKKTLKK